LLVTACTATVLLVGLPMHDELQALRVERQQLTEELKTAQAHEEDLAGEVVNLDAARERLSTSLAQKSMELEDALRARADLDRRLKDEIKKNEEHNASAAQAARGRKSRRH
jgi:chromosome segregation ATPase